MVILACSLTLFSNAQITMNSSYYPPVTTAYNTPYYQPGQMWNASGYLNGSMPASSSYYPSQLNVSNTPYYSPGQMWNASDYLNSSMSTNSSYYPTVPTAYNSLYYPAPPEQKWNVSDYLDSEYPVAAPVVNALQSLIGTALQTQGLNDVLKPYPNVVTGRPDYVTSTRTPQYPTSSRTPTTVYPHLDPLPHTIPLAYPTAAPILMSYLRPKGGSMQAAPLAADYGTPNVSTMAPPHPAPVPNPSATVLPPTNQNMIKAPYHAPVTGTLATTETHQQAYQPPKPNQLPPPRRVVQMQPIRKNQLQMHPMMSSRRNAAAHNVPICHH